MKRQTGSNSVNNTMLHWDTATISARSEIEKKKHNILWQSLLLISDICGTLNNKESQISCTQSTELILFFYSDFDTATPAVLISQQGGMVVLKIIV